MALKRTIGFWVLLLLAINAIIGTGIYFAPGLAAFVAGPASLLSWILVSGLAILIAAHFAELSSLTKESGGVYEYAKMAFGDFVGFMVGWMSWILANVTIAMLIIGGIAYLKVLIHFPAEVGVFIAIFFVLFMNYISFKGINVSVKVLLGFSIITIVILILIMIFGLSTFDLGRLDPFFILPEISILVAMYFIIETFFGWESVTFLAEETIDPQKNMPKAMMWGTVAVIVLVLGTVFISLTSLDWQTLASSTAPLIEIVKSNVGETTLAAMIALVFLNVMGSAAAWIISTPRLVYAMANDNSLPRFLSYIHPKNKTPYFAIAIQTIITLFVLSLGEFRALLEVVLPLAIAMYAIVILSVPVLRKKMPNAKRTFKVPFVKVIPQLTVAALIFVFLMGFSPQGVILGISLIMLGIPLYIIACLGYHEYFIKHFNNLSAGFNYATYDFFVGHDVLKNLYNYFNDITMHKLADFGCGVGVATHQLAKRIPLSSTIYGIDFSKKELEIAKKHQKQRDIKNIEYLQADIYNLGEKKEVDTKLKNLDGIMGIGVLESLPDPVTALNSMKKRLKKGGKFYFIDYDFISHIFDKAWIEDDEKIKKVFSTAGFRVKIWRQNKLFWQVVHMYGFKE